MILVKGREDVFRKRPILGRKPEEKIFTKPIIFGRSKPMLDEKSSIFDPNKRNMNKKTFAEELKELHLASIKESREKESMQRQNITGDNNTQISAGGNVRTDRPEVDIFRGKRPVLGNRILVPSPNRDKPVKVKEPVQNVPLPKVELTPPKPEAPQESSPMDAAMEEIRRAAEERERFAQMMGGAFSDGTNMITGLSPDARDMIGLLMAQGIPANQAQDIARQKLGE